MANPVQPLPFAKTARIVHGHDGTDNPLKGERTDERLMYLALPRIPTPGEMGPYVGAIRRRLVAEPPGFQEQEDWIWRRFPGQEPTWNGESVGILNLIPPDKIKGRMYPVRVRFPHPLRGPLAVGAGRYRGFGLFAAAEELGQRY